ncbi:MAG TPA: hypothetical protein ENN14_02730 [Chloroflexi bacterium]|nr:hypothetical protein [Chloroflexota bacterium]
MIKTPKRWQRTLGVYIFFLGVLLGMIFAGLLAWADLEGFLFDAKRDSNAINLESLRCPALLNRHETGMISATFSNPSDVARRRTVDARISHGFLLLVREERARFDLEPGERHTLEWPISAEDAAWGRLILVRIDVQRNNPLPARSSSCGILVVDLPFGTGGQITGFVIGLTLLLMGGGAALWITGARQHGAYLRRVDYLALATAPVTLLALIFGMTGFWLGSGLLLMVTFLLIVSIVTWVLS